MGFLILQINHKDLSCFRNVRSSIHTNLCVNLLLAHLLTVTALEACAEEPPPPVKFKLVSLAGKMSSLNLIYFDADWRDELNIFSLIL